MYKKLECILADIFGLRATDIHLELRKCDVGTWDSLKQMELVMSLEREYGIMLDIPDIVRMNSVAEIMSVLKGKGVDFES